MTAPVPLATLNQGDAAAVVATLGGIVEASPWVARRAAARRPFASLAALEAAFADVLGEASPDEQLEVLRAHPDLAGRAARAGTLGADSTAEQASAGLDHLTEAEHARFGELNRAYRERFGFPFVICARRHAKAAILAAFAERLARTADTERAAAIAEVADIARLRLRAAVLED